MAVAVAYVGATVHDITVAFRAIDLSVALGWHRDDAIALYRPLLHALTGRTTRDDAIEAIADQLDLSDRQAMTLYDTIETMVRRTVGHLDVVDINRALFLYVGPLDTRTRAFCLRYVGKVLKKADIDRLDNRQLADPFVSGGGYNCRHEWQAVDRSSAVFKKLQRTGGRIPRIQQRMKRLGIKPKRAA